MEKIVKGATKIKLAAPKSKYIESILSATNGGESGVAEIFRTLQLRLRDSTWTIVFKSLIVVHLMIREGAQEVTLRYIAESPKRIAISGFTEVQTQGTNIRRYSEYLMERVRGYRDTKTDFVKAGAGQMRRLNIDKGLLRQTEIVQDQIRALLRCDLLGSQDPDNEITLTAFRLLTMDLLELFKVMNEGTINVLEHYFEMSRPDAERALTIYKTFGKQTDMVVQYLGVARQYAMSTRLEVPKLKHAPTTLTNSLEEYLNDPDFEIHRRQYLAQIEAKRTGRPVADVANSAPRAVQAARVETSAPVAMAKPTHAQPKGPAPDLIDFFDSIDQNQQTFSPNAAPQQQYDSGYVQNAQYVQPQTNQQTGFNPFLQSQNVQQSQQPQPLQSDYTGAGFGGYGPQPQQQQQHQQQQQQHYYSQPFQFSPLSSIPQNGIADFSQMQQQQPPPPPQEVHSPTQLQPQQTSTNPFRQSMMPSGASHSPQSFAAPTRSSTNPFSKQPTGAAASAFGQDNSGSFMNSQSQPQPQPQPQTRSSTFPSASTNPQDASSFSPAPLQAQRTGTNPFAKNRLPPLESGVASPPSVNVTGSTNPFRQSHFVNQETGQGWQHSAQGTFSGFDLNNVPTQEIFPRPGAG